MKKVQYEEMLPHELAVAIEEFPVAYVPVGSLEWHGRHLPLGNDAMKAHAICVCAAQKYGGVVVPPTFWGHMGHWCGCDYFITISPSPPVPDRAGFSSTLTSAPSFTFPSIIISDKGFSIWVWI